nr:unnamed protein product [Callosobruchus chinensis]
MDMDLGGFNFGSLGSMGSLKSMGEAGDAEEAFKKDHKELKGILFKKGVDKKGSQLELEKAAEKKGSAVAKEAKGESGEWNSGQEKKQAVSDALGYKGKKVEEKEGDIILI